MVLVKVGAAGEEEGCRWDHAGQTQIVQIIVSHSYERLYSLQFTYLDDNGNTHTPNVVGQEQFFGGLLDVISFKGGNEYVTKVEGLHDYRIGTIKKLSIHTNVEEYTVFEAVGCKQPHDYRRFCFNFEGLIQFGGLHGSYKKFGEITAIGVYFLQADPTPTSTVEIDLARGSTSY